MKTVFNNSQVAHVWAQQNQENGRNSSSTLYFNSEEIYSYGSHYLAANFVTKDIVLVNSHHYSSATGGHLSDIYRALRDLKNITVFTVPKTSELKCLENFNYYNNKVLDYYFQELKSIKVNSQYSIDYTLKRLNELLDESNEYFKAAGYPEMSINNESINILKDHLIFRFNRYQELNSPENIAKKQAIKDKKALLEQEKQLEKMQENISNFNSGENFNNMYNLPYDLIRVKNDQIETSSRSYAPLKEALKMFNSVLNETFKVGDTIGHFTLENITENENDKIVKVGCHRFLFSHVKEVLEKFNTELKLVE